MQQLITNSIILQKYQIHIPTKHNSKLLQKHHYKKYINLFIKNVSTSKLMLQKFQFIKEKSIDEQTQYLKETLLDMKEDLLKQIIQNFTVYAKQSDQLNSMACSCQQTDDQSGYCTASIQYTWLTGNQILQESFYRLVIEVKSITHDDGSSSVFDVDSKLQSGGAYRIQFHGKHNNCVKTDQNNKAPIKQNQNILPQINSQGNLLTTLNKRSVYKNQSTSNILESFDSVVRQFSVQKIDYNCDLSESQSTVRQFDQMPFEYSVSSDDELREFDSNDVGQKIKLLKKQVKLDQRNIVKLIKLIQNIEKDQLDVLRSWIKRIYELQKYQLTILQKQIKK